MGGDAQVEADVLGGEQHREAGERVDERTLEALAGRLGDERQGPGGAGRDFNGCAQRRRHDNRRIEAFLLAWTQTGPLPLSRFAGDHEEFLIQRTHDRFLELVHMSDHRMRPCRYSLDIAHETRDHGEEGPLIFFEKAASFL